MAYTDYFTAKPLWFALKDHIYDVEPGSVTLVPRSSCFDADSLSLVAEASRTPELERVYIAVRNRDAFFDNESSALDKINNTDTDISIVEIDTLEFISALSTSEILFLLNQFDVFNYRMLSNRSKRDTVRIHHGIITKATGNFMTKNLQKGSMVRRDKLGYPHPMSHLINVNIDVQSVESDVESFYRSAAEGRHPRVYKRYGYPRFDRLNRLKENPDEALLSQEAKNLLETDRSNVLYAPTHKDGMYETDLFPFENFDTNELVEYLEKQDIQLFLRLHMTEESADIYEEFVDSKHVHRADAELSSSPTEILPFFDTLITDYSSIYLDFLPMDRPIMFLKDDHEKFMQTRGIAFDYERYFPGRKVETFEKFQSHLISCIEGDDGHQDDRDFVRRVLLPERKRTFLQAVVNNHVN